ncbi:S1 domain-containing RNA-binding protein [Guptibacillus algicola]|uniref:S1 domain-containing RNA-binding protein n=1 Tax=Guptibacillus algicola TaxID=225844 RepID=UPI001CD6BACD|nr:S1 domain-containing RNA-binding protein [Alkalihalobacillus algicola]MCA0989554.1 RNA-binding protein S1 [Alkalihalobacillus algicola]
MAIEVGSKLQGKVTGITNFGAFVELPDGKTGLVHISEVADNYVKDINDFLSVGDQVEVKVIQVENDGKIGLSIKKAKDRPVSERPRSSGRPGGGRPGGGGFKGKPRGGGRPQVESFEDKMNKFLKDSEDRLSTLKKQTESKRGGRGARRG